MLQSVLLALLSGILYVFSFAPWDLAHLQWIAFVPLFFAVDWVPSERKSSWAWRMLPGLVPATVVCIGGFYWMIYATQQYGGLPFSAALAVFGLFTLTGQLQIPFHLWVRERIDPAFARFPLLRALFSGLAYAGIESLYPKLFRDTAGHAFYHSPWIRQVADLGGPFLLTVLIIAVNELIYTTIRTRSRKTAFLALLIPGLASLYGIARVQEYRELESESQASPALRLTLVQANIGDYLKVAAERGGLNASDEVMGKYLRLSTQATHQDPKPDALVWPETAYPAIYQKPKSTVDERNAQFLNQLLKELDGTLLFGGYDSDDRGQEYNSLFLVNPKSNTRDVYHKSILLMFGETLPFSDSFPEMREWFPTMGFFGRGPGPTLHRVQNQSGVEFFLAPSICYEGLFTDHAVEGARLGADALINITNDSWFGPWGEPYLHLALTQFRSIETRLPLVRSTNTGISVWIDPLGETRGSTGIMTEALLPARIQKAKMAPSPYVRLAGVFGPNWFIRFCELVTLGFFAWRRWARSSPRHLSKV